MQIQNQNQYRRSKKDNEGRDFKCQICEKTYLSNPAMYNHMKNKHAMDPTANKTSNRGRPKLIGGGSSYKFDSIDPTSDVYL